MKRKTSALVALLFLTYQAWTQTQTIISPTSADGTRLYGPIQRQSRMQQVYSSADFAAVPSGGRITEIAFRYAFQLPIFTGGTASNVIISLSTTQKAPDSLSPVFAENTGPDALVVYGTAPAIMPPGDRLGFDVFIALTSPFFYDPQAGNLLLDVRNFGPVTPLADDPGFDARNVIGDSVSRLWADNPNGSVGSLDTVGVITRFTFQPIPEPSATALMVLAGLGCFAQWRLATLRRK
jgi:hypothetical protein